MRTLNRKSENEHQAKNDPLMTQVKFDELTRKLERLKKSRPEAANEVTRLAELGDFSENVEYQLAKGKLRSINHKILLLEAQLNQSVIIQTNSMIDAVQVGHTVTIETEGKTKTYQILGSSETDPARGIISHNSTIGSAIVGSKIGEVVKIKLANREVEYKIIAIE